MDGRKRIPDTVQQELPQRRASDGATRSFAEPSVLQAGNCAMDRTGAGNERFRQWLVTLLRHEEQAKRDGDIEGTQGRLRWHRRQIREDRGGVISESVTARAAPPLAHGHPPSFMA